MSRLLILAALVAVVFAFTGRGAPSVQADTPTVIEIAIPNNVTVISGQTEATFIGRPMSTSPVNCAPGTPQAQTVNVVDPGSGDRAEISGVLAFHDHTIPLGTRYLITGDGAPCNADLKLYQATLIN